jgi:hypothetical protein
MSQGFTRGVPIDTDPNLSLDSDLVVPSQKAVKDYVDTGLADKVNRAGDTMAGNLILNVNPTLPLQAATKDYVDTLINGIDWKQAADAGTVAVLPAYTVTGSGQILTGNVNGAIPSVTTDGVTLTANQRLLVKNETSTLTPNNGIYVVSQVGSGSQPFILTRSSDANSPALLAEATLAVRAGTTLANTQWHCNPAAVPIVIGTTNITFAQIGGGTYTFSPPLAVAGNIVSIPAATSSVDGYLTQGNFNTFFNKLTSTLADTQIFVGNASNIATAVPMTGDLSIANTGATTLKNNLRTGTFGVTVDGVTGVVQVGTVGYVVMPYAGTITGWSITSNVVGTISFDITSASGAIPTVSIIGVGGNYPTLISNQFITSTIMTSWTLGFAAGDVFGFSVRSSPAPSLIKNATLTIRTTKT